MIAVDDTGRVDVDRLRRQQFARIETALAPAFARPDAGEHVVDAGDRFLAQGGSWTPGPVLEKAMDDAALGLRKCVRLSGRHVGHGSIRGSSQPSDSE